MKKPAVPADEVQRIASLRQTGLLDTSAEPAFDELVRLAALICGVPTVLVSLVDEDRQWFKARIGLVATETPRDVSFCGHAILTPDDVFVVPNALHDSRFSDNPLVLRDPNIRFYAGAPLVLEDGAAIGTLCVIDSKPRQLDDSQIEALRILGRQVVAQIELRRQIALSDRARKDLELSERRSRQMVEDLPVGIFVLGANGKPYYANRRSTDILGKGVAPDAAADQLAKVYKAYIAGTDVEYPADRLPVVRALQGESVYAEDMEIDKDGTRVPLKIWANPIFGNKGDVVYCVAVFEDISESRRIESALRESEERYRDIFETASDLIQSVGPDGRYQYVNTSWRKTLGYEDADVSQLSMDNIIDTQSMPHCMKVFDRLKVGQDSEFVEATFVARDGGKIEVEGHVHATLQNGKLHGTRGIFRNVTDRRRAETMLRESELRFRQVIEHSPVAKALIDGDGRITLVNKAFEQVFGYDRSDLLGKEIDNLLPENIRDAHHGYINTYRDNPSARSMGAGRELFGRKEDGSLIPVEIGLSPVAVPGEALVLASILDLTERRRVERMKDEFISTVNHELRTPLTSIHGSLSLLLGGVAGELPETARQLVDVAARNSRRLGLLVNDILDIGKIESGRLVLRSDRIQLCPFLREALSANSSYAEQHGVKFQLECPLDDFEISADPDRLMQVMTNLLSNAAKFSPRGGIVRVSVGSLPRGARIAVEDKGPGMSAEFQKVVFNKFSQEDSGTSRRSGGTGLGLSISQALTEKMGGQIGFESSPGVGTTFYIEMPAAASA